MQEERNRREQNMSVAGLARELGTAPTAVRRILGHSNASISLKTIVKTASALGLKLSFQSEPLSPAKLGKLANKLASASSATESAELKDEIVKGF
jgi:transcriptional regulator with XRE-family HTH domain